MSQFDNKFTRHYHTPKESRGDEVVEWTIRDYIKNYYLFEIAVILLLLLILFCICTQKSCSKNSTPTEATKQTKVFTPTPTKSEKEVPKSESILLGKKYPEYVLPSLKELLPTVDEPLSIQKYMYFVHDTQSNYPNFIDAKTSRYILSKKPECYTEECSIASLTKENQKAYIEWLEKMTKEHFSIQKRDKYYYIH